MADNKFLQYSIIRFLIKTAQCIFMFLGGLLFLALLLSFTDLPYKAYHGLGSTNDTLDVKPSVLVVLGGCGMPSPDGLMRTYYAASAAHAYPGIKIIIALPYNENEKDSMRQLDMMAHELIVKGIDSSRIQYEPLGFNTRSQAINIAAVFKGNMEEQGVLIITSPEHMYRSLRAFRKAGFKHAGGIPAFEKPVDEDMVKDKENSRDKRVKSLALRYNMWSYLNYELLVLREYAAIGYYKIKGWI